MNNLTDVPREGSAVDGIVMVTVSDAGQSDATVIFPGQTEASQKRYPYAIDGMQLTAGERAYAILVSGVWVLLGGTVSGGGGTSHGIPAGGALHDALVKASASNYDAAWSPLLYRGADGGLCEVDSI